MLSLPDFQVIQLNVFDFVIFQHRKYEKETRVLLVFRVLIIEHHLVMDIVINRVARNADHFIELPATLII